MANLIDTDSKNIGERAEGFGFPGIIRDSNGRIYTGHITDSNTLEIHYSDNNGSTWNLDETFSLISGTSSIDMYSFTVSDQDDIFLTYSLNEGSDVYTLKVKKRDHTSGNWSEILEETSITSESIILHPLITWNRYESNRLHVFWLGHTPSANAIIYNKYSDNYGNSWTSGTNKTLDDNIRTISSLDTDPTNGDVYLTEYNTVSETYPHLYKFSSVGVYQNVSNLEQTRDNFGLYVSIDSTGNRWIAFYGEKNNWYSGILLKNDEAGILFHYTSGTHALKKGMFSIGIDGVDNIYIFYTKPDGKAYYKKYDKDTETLGDEVSLTVGDGLRVNCEQHNFIRDDKLNFVYYVT